MHTTLRVILILGISAAAAASVNAMREKPIAWLPDPKDDPRQNRAIEVTFEDVRQHQADLTAVFIDARGADEYAAGHLDGAYNLPSDAINEHMEPIWRNVPMEQLVIIYCTGGQCESSHNVFDYLKSNGFTNLRIFVEGWEAIEPSDLLISSGSAPYGGGDSGMSGIGYMDGGAGDSADTNDAGTDGADSGS
jgi:rhodanese-related sulfurtransferase